MAAAFKITIEDAQVRAALSRVTWRALDLAPPLVALGEFVEAKLADAFASETSPKGVPWRALAPRTREAFLTRRRRGASAGQQRRRRNLSRTRRGAEHIGQAAQEPGWLLRALQIVASAYELEVGEHIGAAGYRFEFGDNAIGDARRPFVELTDAMRAKADELLLAWLDGRWF